MWHVPDAINDMWHVPDAINDTCRMLLMYSMYFVVVTMSSQLLAKHSSAALPCKRFVNKRL